MAKDNSHPFNGEIVYLGTKHDKAIALAPHFQAIGMTLEAVIVDTDEFGTFTGEVERKGTVKETLRRKILAVAQKKPSARFILASEGSFGPHPYVGFIQSDIEVLLFSDQKSDLEVFVDELSMKTNHDEIELSPADDLKTFLERVQFPSHGLIVRPKGVTNATRKGLQDLAQLRQVINEGFRRSPEAKVILSTDMRASFNPTRMSVISKAGEKLVSRLRSFCPECESVGFAPAKGISGLPCSECGLSTQAIKEVVWSCPKCSFEENRDRDDGLKNADPGECEFCNP